MTKKVKTSITLPEETVQESRDAVAFLSGPPLYLTFAELLGHALQTEVDRLKEHYNNGKPFPRFEGKRKSGRRLER